MSKRKTRETPSARDYTARMVERLVPLSTISPHPDNPRQHPDTQIVQLQASHEHLGQFEPVILWQRSDGYVQVKGHGYVEGVKLAKDAAVKAWILPEDTPDAVVKQIMLASNLHAMNSTDDPELLARLLQEQKDLGIDLAIMGSDDETLRQMLESLGDAYIGSDEQEEEDDTLPEDVETRCKLGDIWQLGKHRIACCDAFDPLTYKKLLDGITPHAIITDPPYGMRLDTDYSDMKGGGDFVKHKHSSGGRAYVKVEGDDNDFDASPLMELFSYVPEQFWFGADYYSVSLGDTMHSGCWLVWDKRVDENLDAMFGSCFELIWSKARHKRDIIRQKWAGLFGTEHEPQRGRKHPTQKPVRLFEDLLTRYTSEGQIILDPFMGSGTTLISAERTGRIIYGCELSPTYCDVVIARWEAETGQTAVLLERVEEAAHV